MDPAKIFFFCNPTQKRADGDIPASFRVTHFKDHDTSQIARAQAGAGDRCTPLFHKSHKPAKDIDSFLFHPDIHISGSRCYTGTENPATETALFAGLIFGQGLGHGRFLPLFTREKDKSFYC